VLFSGCINPNDQTNMNQENQINDSENKKDVDNSTNTTNTSTVPILKFDEVEISDYQVITTWTTGCCGEWEDHEKQGFYQQLPIWENANYVISGVIKNRIKQDVEHLIINITFFNETHKRLFDLHDLNKSYEIIKLQQEESVNFSITINPKHHYQSNDVESFDISFDLFNSIASFEFGIHFKE
jgi:hypothetical protein